jgi:hypothetical protein
MQLLNTLYVTLPESYVHLDNNTVRLEVEHETRLRVPLPSGRRRLFWSGFGSCP